ncbi:MAG TPA: hypothetical protein PL155_06955 [Candidatus Omnitrophota bacterium]|nr:hypothetical protein [Candidatus Omnitrophota bacterium]HPD85552.1 hypothetical protein [Candidatus Omnitrophota bacterium]HRZ04408.1 hypothetical protein [Candidatus Omnitrophota bacterium]
MPKVDELVDEARVLDTAAFKSGGNLLIVPFRPGPGVEANDKMEKISLMAFKGIMETLGKARTPFRILTNEDAENTDLVLKGHVTALGESRGVTKWVAGQEKSFLAIEGQMSDPETGKNVLVFSYREIVGLNQEDYQLMSYRIGQRVGEFILSQLN